jgi:SLT domain-containing protein
MAGIGGNLVEGLLRGLMSSAGSVGKVVVKIFGSIPNALGAIVGKGLIALEKLPASALKLLGGLGGKIGHFFSNLFHGGPAGAGVQRWAGTVLQALAMLHMPAGLLPRILYQMQTESGGNPNAINLTDINAQRGDPSRGLMQTIGSTFAAYHVPGTSNNIYDPLANIAAAINYARHVYGPTLGALGSGHGYAAGTGGATPGWAWVGERGPELVNFVGGEMVLPNGALGGYASGTASAAESLAAHNRALAMAAAAFNRMAKAGASLAAAIAKITPKTTAGVFASDQAKFLADLRLYFTPSVAKARSQLVINQIKQLQSLQTHIKTLSANIANATAFQQQELAHLRSTGGIGAIGIQGVGAAGGRSILTGLSGQLTNMRNFGYAVRDLSRAGGSQALLRTVAAMDPASGTVYARKMISALNKMHSMKLSPEMINQLVALGPDAALAYVNAIQAAGPSVLRQIKSTEAALASATLGTSRGIASVVSGGAYNTGANFVAGLKSQEKSLEKQFAHLGRVLGQEAIKWMHVPANKRPYGYQHGGWLNEPVSGIGMYTGASYTFAETGREYVLPEGQMGTRGGDGDSYHAHFDGLTGEAIESHVRTAFAAMSLTRGSLNRQGRRS